MGANSSACVIRSSVTRSSDSRGEIAFCARSIWQCPARVRAKYHTETVLRMIMWALPKKPNGASLNLQSSVICEMTVRLSRPGPQRGKTRMFDYVLHAAEYVFTEAGRRTASAYALATSGCLLSPKIPNSAPISFVSSHAISRQMMRPRTLQAFRQSVCTGRNAIGYIDSGFPSWRP
jgi:hypothetical protein